VLVALLLLLALLLPVAATALFLLVRLLDLVVLAA
jgi:hypothetical protein